MGLGIFVCFVSIMIDCCFVVLYCCIGWRGNLHRFFSKIKIIYSIMENVRNM